MIFQSMIGSSGGGVFTENGHNYGNITASSYMNGIIPEGTNLILVYASIRTTDFQYVTFCTPGRTTEIGYLQCSWDKDTNKITIKNGSAVIMDFCYTCLA